MTRTAHEGGGPSDYAGGLRLWQRAAQRKERGAIGRLHVAHSGRLEQRIVMVQVTIVHPGGKRETRQLSSAEDFHRFLGGLHKKASIALDGGPARDMKWWRGNRPSWPWSVPSPAGAAGDSGRAGDEVAPSLGHGPPPPGRPNATTSIELPTGLTGRVVRVDDLAAQVERIRRDVDGLAEQVRPLRGQIDEVGTRLEHRLTNSVGDLHELRATLHDELRGVGASIAELTSALGDRPEKTAISGLVERSVAQVEDRILEALRRLREENELLAEEGEEQRRRIKAYRPGTIEELRQRIEELHKEVEERRSRLTEAHIRIDQLERDNALLKENTGALDLDELTRIRKDIAAEREGLEGTRQLALQRDELLVQLAEYQQLEQRYRAAQEVRERDIALEQRLREVERQRADLEADLSQVREEAWERQRRMDSLLKQRHELQGRNESLARLNEELRADHDRMVEQVTALTSAMAELAKDRESVAAERRELSAWRTRQELALETRGRELEDDARGRIESQERQHAERMAALVAEHAHRREVVEATVRAELAGGLERQLRQATRDRDAVIAERDRLAAELEERRAELARMRALQADWDARQYERTLELDRHRAQLEDLAARRDRLERDLDEQRAGAAEHLGSAHAEVQRLEGTIASLAAQAQGARAQLASLEQRYRDELELVRGLQAERRRLEEPAAREVRVRSMTQPMPGFTDRDRATEAAAELDWLDRLAARMRDAEFAFPRRLLEAFHTSLKIPHWSPLTVLAGMSGTGKSALSRLYAHFGGLRFHMVPVQPNWDSPQDLFGFFNHIDGLYKATPLLRALVQSQRPPSEGGFQDGLLLLALDEMNLARVEYYASELLSRWEARRDGVAAEALQLDIGHGEHETVTLGSNVMWVGTMNEDETTFSLSDKVLERGNVIMFPRPPSLLRRERVSVGSPAPWLSARTFAGWTAEPSSLPAAVRDKMKGALEELNRQLGRVHRSVSHRTLQAIEHYVANHPRVRAHASDGTDRWWKQAFADQLVQRVLPKLRGLDNHASREKDCLDGFARVLREHADELVSDFAEARQGLQFRWTSAAYLERTDPEG